MYTLLQREQQSDVLIEIEQEMMTRFDIGGSIGVGIPADDAIVKPRGDYHTGIQPGK